MKKNYVATEGRGLLSAGKNAWTKVVCAGMLFGAISNISNAQNTKDSDDTLRTSRLQAVTISDTRVSNKAPLTTTTVNHDALQDERGNVSLPFMLETQPSVVASGENGTVGATKMTIRGVDGSRINVNINGITLNDAESQEVFWYNIPNLGGMAQSLQIQRGVGASTGGSPAFGAAINMQTLNARNSAYGEADLGFGSWNTHQYSVSAGTGIMKNGLSFDAAYSGLTSDGFLRGGQTDQQSFFGSAAWYGERTLVKVLAIIGKQITGITWNGATAEDLDADPTYNDAGAYYDQFGNVIYYPNETDNYWQRHYQLYVSHLLGGGWSINGALDFTHGDGYYEQMKNKKYKDYDLTALEDGVKHNFVTRKEMYNNAYTANVSLRHNGERSTLSVGDNFLFYDGEHYGSIISFRDSAVHIDTPYEWYRNYGDKTDNTFYVKGTYDFSSKLNGYADMQLRMINYKIYGYADDLFDMDFEENYLFFNPKLGLNYRISDNQRTYFVAALTNREPRRADIKDAIGRADTIKAEHMLDFELGYQIQMRNWNFSINGYAMLYKDQMTPSGDFSSSGYALMENVDKSYRIGVEMMAGVKLSDKIRLDANLTLSNNKVIDNVFTEFTDGDTVLQTVTRTTDLALSPNIIGAAIATFTPVKNLNVQLIGKYVGKQYSDNTSCEEHRIDPYFLLNFKASYTFHLNGTNEIEAQLLVNNLLDKNYRLSAGAWDYDYDGAYYHLQGYLQQPGRNFMGRVIYRF